MSLNLTTGEASGLIVPPVRPEVLAAKLAAIRNLEYSELMEQVESQPRLVELLWFIQAMSFEPGGLRRVASDLVAEFPGCLGTEAMLACTPEERCQLSWKKCCELWKSIPGMHKPEIDGDPDGWHLNLIVDDHRSCEEWEKDQTAFRETLNKFRFETFQQLVVKVALQHLGGELASFCNEGSKSIKGPWYFPALIPSLLEFIDSRATRICKRLAMTEVAAKVFDALEYACREKVLVKIEGDPRFGKTETVTTWCDMWPGRIRYVKVPCSNGDGDLFREVAKALGIQFSFKANVRDLKEKIEYVLYHGQLAIVMDESQWLFPSRFSEFTPPARLDWVRTAIVDNRLPCVLISTPQTRDSASEKFLRKTRYRIEQFTGRIAMPVLLPSELPRRDLLAVARIEFPHVDEIYLELIAAKAMQSESYLKGVSDIARRARYLANKAQRESFTLEDIDQAILDVFPAHLQRAPAKANTEPKHLLRRSQAKEMQPRCTADATPIPGGRQASEMHEFTGETEQPNRTLGNREDKTVLGLG